MTMALKELFLLVFLLAFVENEVLAQVIYASPPPPSVICTACDTCENPCTPVVPASPPPPSPPPPAAPKVECPPPPVAPKIECPPPPADLYPYGTPPPPPSPPRSQYPYYPYYNINSSPPLYNPFKSCSFFFLVAVLPLLHFLF